MSATGERTGKPRSGSRRILLLKLLLSGVAVTYVLIARVDLTSVARELVGIRWPFLLAALGLHILGLLFSSVRWHLLLAAQDVRVPIHHLGGYYLIANFFNLFLPGRTGGDLKRVADITRKTRSAAEPTAVILVERGTGLLTLLALAVLVLAFRLEVGFDAASFVHPTLAAIAFVAAILTGALLVLSPPVTRWLLRILSLGPLRRLEPWFRRLIAAINLYKCRRGHFAGAVLAGALLQVNYVLHYYLVARALGLHWLPLAFFFFVIPVRAVLLMAPFFINGIGLRELVDSTAFGLVHIDGRTVTAAQAVAFSELSLMLVMVYGLLGAVLFVLWRKG